MSWSILRRVLSNSHQIYNRKCIQGIYRRGLLSSSYSCDDAWAEYIKNPMFGSNTQEHAGNFFLQVQDKFDRESAVSTIDMDILAHKVELINPKQLDFVQTLFKRFRHTPQSAKTLASTCPALVRGLLKAGQAERLLEMITDKVEYGLFLDSYGCSLLLDHFIEAKDYQMAAVVAYDQMLQEDLRPSTLTHALSWYSCYQHFKNLPAAPEPQEEEDEEMVYLPIGFIENPYFDDHFDLDRDSLKLGKTLVMLSRGRHDVVANSCRLLGWALYEKVERALGVLEGLIDANEPASLGREALEQVQNVLEGLPTKEPAAEEKDKGEMTVDDLRPWISAQEKEQTLARLKELVERAEASAILAEHDLTASLLQEVHDAREQHEAADTAAHRQGLDAWSQQRSDLLDEEVKQHRIQTKKQEIINKLEELRRTDEKLRYFEQEERIDLGILRQPKMKPIEDVKEEALFVLAPGERGRGKN